MKQFTIFANRYLTRNTMAFYHVQYVRWKQPGNPDYLNDLKNTFNTDSNNKLNAASHELRSALMDDLPKILALSECDRMTVCVVPRAKAENQYKPTQLLFRSTVQSAIGLIQGFEDGTMYIQRHTNTKTTHIRKIVRNYDNDGCSPYPRITADTCQISTSVRDKDILLIDDIYTPDVNIDEDAIQALIDAGARSVVFYAVGRTIKG